MSEKLVLLKKQDRVGLLTLNRPKALNALCADLISQLNEALDKCEADDDVGALVITGSEKAFAAGADIKEMQTKSFADVYDDDFIAPWERIVNCRKPVIAAVRGFALGGGCELAMMCDIIIAGQCAKFGQPEIKLGTIPGAGGTQRLIRRVGKSKAMELCLTGRMMGAEEALSTGLVAHVYPSDQVVEEAMSMAKTIAEYSNPVIQMVKEAINHSEKSFIDEGVRFERRLFHSSFGLEDRREGMEAFAEKRPPKFKHR